MFFLVSEIYVFLNVLKSETAKMLFLLQWKLTKWHKYICCKNGGLEEKKKCL